MFKTFLSWELVRSINFRYTSKKYRSDTKINLNWWTSTEKTIDDEIYCYCQKGKLNKIIKSFSHKNFDCDDDKIDAAYCIGTGCHISANAYIELMKMMLIISCNDRTMRLRKACKYGNIELAKMFIKIPNLGPIFCLNSVCAGGNLEILKIFIKSRGNKLCYSYGFGEVCSRGNNKLIKLLLGFIGLDINIDWNWGLSGAYYIQCPSK